MRNRLEDFIRNTDGAVTVDWVVLAAAVVGLGVTSVNVVRSGSNALAGDIQTALGAASVALVCQEGSYELRALIGDRDREASDVAGNIARLTDAELQSQYLEVVTKVGNLRADGEGEERINENLDYAALFIAEMDRRGQELDRGSPTLNELAGIGGGACGDGSGGGAEAAHELAYYNDPRLEEDYRAYQEEFRRLDSGVLSDTVAKIDEQFHEAINNGSLQDAAKLLDLSYMIYQEALSRGDERQTAEAQARYERAYATWLETRR